MRRKKLKINKQLRVNRIVEIITGTDKGKTGKLLSINLKKNKAIVQGINLKFRHCKPTEKDKKGEVKQIELPIDCSNIKVTD